MLKLAAKDFPDVLAPAGNMNVALLRQGRARKKTTKGVVRFDVTYAFEVYQRRVLTLEIDVAPEALGDCACPRCLAGLIVDSLVNAIISDEGLLQLVARRTHEGDPIAVTIANLLANYAATQLGDALATDDVTEATPDRSLN